MSLSRFATLAGQLEQFRVSCYSLYADDKVLIVLECFPLLQTRLVSAPSVLLLIIVSSQTGGEPPLRLQPPLPPCASRGGRGGGRAAAAAGLLPQVGGGQGTSLQPQLWPQVGGLLLVGRPDEEGAPVL